MGLSNSEWDQFQSFFWKIRALIPESIEFPDPKIERVIETPTKNPSNPELLSNETG